MRLPKIPLAIFSLALVFQFGLAENPSTELFNQDEIRDTASLKVEVLQDWQPSSKDPDVKQKLLEITVCEWWPGQEVRLPVTLNAPVTGGPCRNLVVANQSLRKQAALPTGGQLTLLKEHGVGIVLIGMGTIDAMEPVGKLHLGMRELLLKTRNPKYSPAWIWGMSQMRALTAAMTEPDVFQPEKVLTTGGSKRGVASATAGIHDDRFTAILPVVAPPLGNPGTVSYVIGTEPKDLLDINRGFYAELKMGKLGLRPEAYKALQERDERRAATRVTLKDAEEAGWTKEDMSGMTDRLWNACRVTDFLPEAEQRGLEIFYNVGTNDSVSPALLQLGEKFPRFPICIIPGGQHGGPATAGFTKQVPRLPEIDDNFLSFALHHFFGARHMISSPEIDYKTSKDGTEIRVTVTFPEGTEPEKNELWWSANRHRPYTLPFEYDSWEFVNLEKTGKTTYEASVTWDKSPGVVDFLSLHTHTENELPITVSSPYRRAELP